MSTSDAADRVATGATAADAGDLERALEIAKAIERFVADGFGGGPAPVAGIEPRVPLDPAAIRLPLDPRAVPSSGGSIDSPAPSGVPPRFGPSALSPGAGGASMGTALPPVPGPVKTPPLATSPPPKESDLRAVPTMVSDAFGSPLSLTTAPDPLTLSTSPYSASPSTPNPVVATPYFLEIAGLPTAEARPLPTTPSPTTPPPGGTVGGLSQAPESPIGGLPTYEFAPALVAEGNQSSRPLEPNIIRRDFPLLDERVNGRPLIWLDNAATTQKPRAVIDRLVYYYEHENSNVHRGAHTMAARATDAYEAARDKVRRFLNAPSSREIIFVRGATEGINLVAQSWGRRHVGPGDEIVITWLEHHANIVPWQQLCSEKGARLRVAPIDSHGQVILDEYERLLGPRTRLASFSQVSNALGTIVPVREMIEMAHRHGALALVDGAQAVSHMPVDVQELDCDFYTFSGHKVFGPTGIGVVFGKPNVLDSMPPWQGGGNMIQDVTFEKTTYQPPPGRFEAGTGSIADAVGLGAALDYVTRIGLGNISTYEHELLAYTEEGLARVPGLHRIGDARERAGVVSFVLDGFRSEDVGAALDREGIAVRSGHHCAQPAVRRFGLESTVRASLAPYNTRADIDALVLALLRLQGGRPTGL